MMKKKFNQVVEENFELLKIYLTADESCEDEAWSDFFGCELSERFSRAIEREVKDFFKRCKREAESGEVKPRSNQYFEDVLLSLREQYKAESVLNLAEISKKLHFSLRRVDEVFRSCLKTHKGFSRRSIRRIIAI